MPQELYNQPQRPLSSDERRLLHLKYGLDLTYGEIAYILGRESGALRIAVHRLTTRLRGELSVEIRETVLAEPRLLGQMAGLKREKSSDGEAAGLDEHLPRLLEDYVEDVDQMSQEDREIVEAALLESTAAREYIVKLERHSIEIEYDVMGHSADVPPMPNTMLQTLLTHALKYQT